MVPPNPKAIPKFVVNFQTVCLPYAPGICRNSSKAPPPGESGSRPRHRACSMPWVSNCCYRTWQYAESDARVTTLP
jgi:hypothetical protein